MARFPTIGKWVFAVDFVYVLVIDVEIRSLRKIAELTKLWPEGGILAEFDEAGDSFGGGYISRADGNPHAVRGVDKMLHCQRSTPFWTSLLLRLPSASIRCEQICYENRTVHFPCVDSMESLF
jgi:hypothetical protein